VTSQRPDLSRHCQGYLHLISPILGRRGARAIRLSGLRCNCELFGPSQFWVSHHYDGILYKRYPSEAKITVCLNVIPIVATKLTKISRKDRNFPSTVPRSDLLLLCSPKYLGGPLAPSRPAGLTLSSSSKCLP
jgi:hypothetical protein